MKDDGVRTSSEPQPPFPSAVHEDAEGEKALEEMLRAGKEKPESMASPSAAGSGDGRDGQLLRSIDRSFARLTTEVAGLREEIGRLRTNDHVLTEMHDRCKALGEQQYERETLRPLLLGVIGISDRCRQQVGRLEYLLKKHAEQGNEPAVAAIGGSPSDVDEDLLREIASPYPDGTKRYRWSASGPARDLQPWATGRL